MGCTPKPPRPILVATAHTFMARSESFLSFAQAALLIGCPSGKLSRFTRILGGRKPKGISHIIAVIAP